MTDIVWVVSSSLLIGVVLLIRALFGKKMRAGFRYALWAIVLIRLLVPGTVFSSPVSVESAVKSSEIAGDVEAVRGVSSVTLTESGAVSASPRALAGENEAPSVIMHDVTPERFERIKKTADIVRILDIIWYSGMALTFCVFAFANIKTYVTLRKRRVRLDLDAPCPVYSVEGISSSCLFLNSVYVSKETSENETELRYVLAHELAHRRHGDGFTSFLRCAALVLHWYNPLVWVAAFVSRRDCEVFADAGAIKTLGEEERENYGLALIKLTARNGARANIGVAATAMTNGKRQLKERITHMAYNKKMGIALALALVLITVTVLGCGMLGGKQTAEVDQTANNTEAPTAGPTQRPTEKPIDVPVVSDTVEPTKAPEATPVPTDEPDAEAAWFIDEAWKLVQEINRLYGTNFEKQECSIIRSMPGERCVRWYKEEPGLDLTVEFKERESGEWKTGMDAVLFFCEPPFDRVDGEKYANDMVQLLGLSLEITVNDLRSAGYEPDGGEGDLDMAAEYMANYVAGLFTGLPDDNYFKCRDAGVVRLVQYPLEWNTHAATIALMPVDYTNWGLAYGDIMDYLCADPDHYGYITLFMNINTVRNDDGSFTVSLNWDD